MRLRIQANHEIVEAADDGIFAGGEFVEFWIFEDEIALAHGAFHLNDAVAHHAAEAGAGFGLVDVLLDGRVHHAAEEESGIVAACAPFGLFHSVDFLHVLDAFAIPLIVEGREVVHGALPLLVDVRVATLAGLGFQEIVGGDVVAVFGLHGAGEEFAVGAVALLIHGGRGDGGIADAVGIFPGDGADPPGGGGDAREYERNRSEPNASLKEACVQQSARGEPGGGKKENADKAESNVGVEPDFETMRRADFDEDDAERAAGEEEEPAETREPGFLGETFKKKEENANDGKDAQTGVKKYGDGIRNVGGGKG